MTNQLKSKIQLKNIGVNTPNMKNNNPDHVDFESLVRVIEKYFNRPFIGEISVQNTILQIQIPLYHGTLPNSDSEGSKVQRIDQGSLPGTLPADDRLKSTALPGPTIRICQVRQKEDRTLQCRACGRKIPSTIQGEIDKDALALEMSLR